MIDEGVFNKVDKVVSIVTSVIAVVAIVILVRSNDEMNKLEKKRWFGDDNA